jgi:glycerol-3-phosphate acyltransferase PlsY
MGAFGALQIKLLIIGGIVLLTAYLVTRRFPLSWVLSLISMPVIAYLLDYPGYVTVPLLVSAGVILIAHKDNIKQSRLTQVRKA